MQHALFGERNPRQFWPLWSAYFLGTLQTSLFAVAIAISLIAADGNPHIPILTIAAIFYLLPLIFLAPLAGQLADGMPKQQIAVGVKLFEIIVAILAMIALITAQGWLAILVMLGLGCRTALFTPTRLSLIKEQLEQDQWVHANAWHIGAFGLAMPVGCGLAISLMAMPGGSALVGILLILSAVAGWMAMRQVTSSQPADRDLIIDPTSFPKPRQFLDQFKNTPGIFRSLLAIGWFWVLTTLYLAQIPSLANAAATDSRPGVLLVLAVFGATMMGAGLFYASKLSGRLSLTTLPLTAVGMAIFSFDLFFAVEPGMANEGLAALFSTFAGWRLLIDTIGLAFCTAIFAIPLHTLIHQDVDNTIIGRTFASGLIIAGIFVLISLVLSGLLTAIGLDLDTILLLAALGSLIAAVLVIVLMPSYALKALLKTLFKIAFRVEVKGLENVDKAGPRTLIVVNHVSWLDGALMMAFMSDLPVFAIYTHELERPEIKPFRKIANLFPIDPTNALALKDLIHKVEEGRPCVIFPEGRLSVTGALMKVYPGPGYVADRADAAIVPVRLDGVERLRWSPLFRGQIKQVYFPKIIIRCLEPRRLDLPDDLKGKARRDAAGQQLYNIMSDMVFRTTDLGETLFDGLIRAQGRASSRWPIVEDFTAKGLTYAQLIRGSMALGRCFESRTQKAERVGVILPNANAAAVSFFGLQAFGRVPAMLNYTAGLNTMRSAVTAADIKLIITSKTFIEKAKLENDVAGLAEQTKILYLEDLRSEIGLPQKLTAFWEGLRARSIHRSLNIKKDDPAVILFTSGSEGHPKGVVLSHGNILANCAQAAARVDYNQLDKTFDALPLFHSFGLTAGFILPTMFGVGVFLYPSPLHYKLVPEMVYANNATIMFGTNSFLMGYARAADPYDFRSLRYVFGGAEKIRDDTREMWSEKFGIRILEGYGATEASPSITTNTPMHNRRGTVGRFLPGIEWRLEPIEGIKEGGRLWIKGPNIMLGYLRFENPGQLEPVADGWYDTGDIASVDEEGYLRLLGRAKRFAKIAGEMVSLAAVEDLARAASPDATHAVVAIADARKGEKLILATTDKNLNRSKFGETIKQKQASDLSLPSDFFYVDELPLLGSGKINYPELTKLANAGQST